MAEEGVSVSVRYARAKKRQIEEERTRATSAGDWGATTQVGHNVIPMPLLRNKRPSWKERAAILAEELQEKREDNRFCCKVRFLKVEFKSEYKDSKGLRMPTSSKSQLCNRARHVSVGGRGGGR
jgi:hypothetical protein